jgi:hypothetical protein
MNFDSAAYLQKATSRAKSDVANKLVGMFLHDVSRKISVSLGLNVGEPRYIEAVVATFGDNCCYCRTLLEKDRAAVEHLDGMNRFQAGLHIPGNVIISCKRCNNEKRRDDQLHELKLAKSGWESFLAHDSTKCVAECKTCAYWRNIWPDDYVRIKNLKESRDRILEFRKKFKKPVQLGQKAKSLLHQELERLYRECQVFATEHIKGSVNQVIIKLGLQR